MKILITGDREYKNLEVIKTSFALFECDVKNSDVIHGDVIHGDARGADKLAGEYAKLLGYNVIAMPADWNKHHRSAGPIRNLEMIEQNPDIVLIFHDDLKSSKGTLHCVTSILKKIEKTKTLGKKKFDPILIFNGSYIRADDLKKIVIG
jgi:hypothetical protein